MAQYKTGTVTVTNGLAIVTGSGTLFSTNVVAGNLFKIDGETVIYTVGSIQSDTQFTLSSNYAGTTGSGKTYTVTKDYSVNRSYPLINPSDVEWPDILTKTITKVDEDVNSLLTAPPLHASTHSIGGTDAFNGKMSKVEVRVDNTNKNYVQHSTQYVSGLTALTVIKTLSPSTTNIYLGGIITIEAYGGTNSVGNGARISRWYFNYANTAPTAVLVDTVASGTGTPIGAPQIDLVPNGNNIDIRVGSSNGTNTFAGLVYTQIPCIKETVDVLWTIT